MDALTEWPLLVRLLALCIPLSFGLSAVLVAPAAPLRRTTLAAGWGLALALLVAGGGALASLPAAAGATLTGGWSQALGVRLDVVTGVMLVLVCSLALVIARYSETYLRGDRGQPRYARWLSATLAAVTLLVLTNDLLVFAMAWMATSLALHQLLTFYPDRKAALVAAHKKFLVSRLADACLLGAIALIAATVGSTRLDVVHAWVGASGALPPSLQGAALLLVVAASLKSAQLPFHGWLTQVMEAPTPVSALLHAGVVNIGGLLMIRLAPLMAQAQAAQTLLVAIGMTTTVVAGLVMTTRVSVKVALAWSTCAQMGFMLVECGLGLWHLALLHLVAHSLYKAHAFLSSGSAVDRWRVESLSPRPGALPLARVGWVGGAILAVAVAGGVACSEGLGGLSMPNPSLAPLVLLLCLAITPLAAGNTISGWRPRLVVLLGALGVVLLQAGGHWASAHALSAAHGSASSPVAQGMVLVGFALLFGLQAVLQGRPQGSLARSLRPRLFAGLYLDELFTRLTFRIWPPRLPAPSTTHATLGVAESQEA
jgi:NAD(P)H-quinone oxidoreductase subunit 5